MASAMPPSPAFTPMPIECHRFSDSQFRPDCAHCVELAAHPPDVLSRHAFNLGRIFKIIFPRLTREIDNLLGQRCVIAVYGRNSVSSSGNLSASLLFCWMKRMGMSAGSKLAEYSAAYPKLVLHDKVGHIVWKVGVVTRSWLHPRRHNTVPLNGHPVSAFGCSCKRDFHFRSRIITIRRVRNDEVGTHPQQLILNGRDFVYRIMPKVTRLRRQ